MVLEISGAPEDAPPRLRALYTKLEKKQLHIKKARAGPPYIAAYPCARRIGISDLPLPPISLAGARTPAISLPRASDALQKYVNIVTSTIIHHPEALECTSCAPHAQPRSQFLSIMPRAAGGASSATAAVTAGPHAE